MSTLKIVLYLMFFASASVAVTQENLVEDQINSKPMLVADAKKIMKIFKTEFHDFAKSIKNETVELLGGVSTVVTKPARLYNVRPSECDQLRLDLFNSVKVAVTKAQVCTTFRVKKIKRLIKKIGRLTHILVNATTNTQSTINSHVGVYIEPTIETIATVKAGLPQENLTVNKNLPKLKETKDELESFLIINQVNPCLETTNEYSIYKTLLSSFYKRTDCDDTARAKTGSAEIIADGLRTS